MQWLLTWTQVSAVMRAAGAFVVVLALSCVVVEGVARSACHVPVTRDIENGRV